MKVNPKFNIGDRVFIPLNQTTGEVVSSFWFRNEWGYGIRWEEDDETALHPGIDDPIEIALESDLQPK